MDFPRIFQSCWAQLGSQKGRLRFTKDFKSLCISPAMLFHLYKNKTKLFLYEQQDMLLMDLATKLFVIVTLDLFNKYSNCVVEFLLCSAVNTYEV